MDNHQLNIKFIGLEAQQKRIYPQIEKRIKAVLAHGKYIMGPEVIELERLLADYVGVRNVITCSSGTDALLMALMAYDVGPGDAVFTTPFSFVATAEVISLLGATPVFVDIDPKTFNLDPEKLELAVKAIIENNSAIYPIPDISRDSKYRINNRELIPRGIIAVDLFGLPADYGRINAIAGKNNLFVIEDGAQSFGAEYKGKKTGSLADIGTTSFFPAKPFGCYGDGGALFTDNDNLAAKIKSIRVHGAGNTKYNNIQIGINGRLDTLQAAILIEKLKIFPKEMEARSQVAEKYSEGLVDFVDTPFIPDGYKSSWAQYSIKSENRKTIMKAFKDREIPVAVYYPKPLHHQTAFSFLNYKSDDFPVSVDTSKEIFSLPMHPYLSHTEINIIIDVIKNRPL